MISIMRKLYKSMIFLAALFLFLAGCAKNADVSSLSPEEPLIKVGDQVIMTAGDFQELLLMQELSEKVKDTAPMKERDYFIYHAEYYLLSYFAEDFGLAYSRDELSEEYDFHLEEIEDTEVYGHELEFLTALQEALGLSEEAYKDWYIDYSIKAYNTENLIGDLTDVYQTITDPTRLEELIQGNLLELCSFYEVEILYPGVTVNDLTFESIY